MNILQRQDTRAQPYFTLTKCYSDQTMGNGIRRYGITPASKRSQSATWKAFMAAHMAVLAGIDFFTVEVLTSRVLATYYVLFFPAS